MIFGRTRWRADEIPERRLARRGRDADARRSAVDVVGDVGAFGVAGERAGCRAPFACANSGSSASPASCSSVFSAPAPRRKPSASIGSIATCGIDVDSA